MTPETIDGYTLVRRLGEGSYGTVHKAIAPVTGEPVAIKLLHKSIALKPSDQNRFVREIAVLQKMRHPNVVRHIDCGVYEGQLYSVMEYVNASTVKHSLEKHRIFSWKTAARIAGQVCLGLDHAHQRGIIHRDLKPANLFLSTSGVVKIGDFGMARDESSHRLTLHGQVLGTPRYISPEQILCDEEISPATDLYALGVVAFEMLTGNLPFNGKSHGELFRQHVSEAPPDLKKACPDAPADFTGLILRLLAKRTKDRPPSAKYVADHLRALVRSEAPNAKAELTAAELAESVLNDVSGSVSIVPTGDTKPRIDLLPPDNKKQ